MYEEFYNLQGRPFQLSPDHRFFYAGRSHQKAMAYLRYGLNEREGFIVITGDIGAGKTTIVGHLMSQMDPGSFVSASVVTTQLEADDALRMVAAAFGLSFAGHDKAALLCAIENFLIESHRRGKHAVLVVDEVQNLPLPALEELRMLSNFQRDGKPLLQCFLLGQPEFRRIMASPDMEQLRQRVIASCHLEPLDEAETRAYIEHRLTCVGWTGDPGISDDAFDLIHARTGGVPRRINALCGRLMLFGHMEELHHLDRDVVAEVARELADEGGAIFDSDATASPSRWQSDPAPRRGYTESLDDLHRRVATLKEGMG